MTTYVDLVDKDGVIQDTKAMDDAFWAANQTAMTAAAAKYGDTLDASTSAPSYSVGTVTSMAQFQNWIAVAQDRGPAPPVTPPSTPVSGGLVVALVGAGLGVAAWMLSRGA